MELKNATAVCLISLFSATLVVLIARALDSQAASRLEPHLARIVEELQAIRAGGGIATSATAAGDPVSLQDGLMVYYFHSNTRCPTCEAIESQAHASVQEHFSAQIENGRVAWKTLNYETPAAADLAAKFEIQMPVVVLARIAGGEIERWNRLDQVWGLVGDEQAFSEYIREEVQGMIARGSRPPSDASPEPSSVRPPEGESDGLPIPSESSELPLP